MSDRPGMTDAARFEAFVREYQDLVFGTALRLVGNPTEAEDVAQTVFLKAFERFDAIGTSPSVPGWLKAVTRNLALNHLTRYRRRWQFFSEMAEADERDTPFAERLAAPEPDTLSADQAAALERALAGLPDHQRVPLVLFHFDEMSYQSIADTLGVSLGKVKTDIHRGRTALRAVLSNSHDD
ncbi:MAG TPA: sigma-70 family RNA polymerase sigma factor [Vicinamibacterales bacterium]|nr:sigma-70 family RNA polymerase sigma factor [Vicinamibacterales bacterium]